MSSRSATRSARALGQGVIEGLRDVVAVIPERFAPGHTRAIAAEVGKLNALLDRVEQRAGVSALRAELAGQAYRRIDLGEVDIVLAVTDRHLYRQRLRQRVQPGATFYEVPIPLASAAAGKRVKDLEWPEEAVLVSIRRDAAVIIPHGDTVLRVNDTITAFGHGDSRIAVAYVLERKLSPEGTERAPE